MQKPKMPSTIGGCQNLIRALRAKVATAEMLTSQERIRAEEAEKTLIAAHKERDQLQAKYDQLQADRDALQEQLDAEQPPVRVPVDGELSVLRAQVARLQAANRELHVTVHNTTRETLEARQALQKAIDDKPLTPGMRLVPAGFIAERERELGQLRGENARLRDALLREAMRAGEAEARAENLQRDIDCQ